MKYLLKSFHHYLIDLFKKKNHPRCKPLMRFIANNFHSMACFFISLVFKRFLLLFFCCSVMSNRIWSNGLQVRLPCLSLCPRVCSDSCPLSRWSHPNISSCVAPFPSCSQSFPSSGSFPISQLFTSGGQSTGASASVLPINDYSGLISFKIDWVDFLAVQGTLKSLL